MDFIIRKYEHDDLDGILVAWESASKLAHPFLTEEFLEKERHDITNVYLPNSDTFVAEKNGHTLGFITLIDHEVGGIFVNPGYHSKGIGKALMNKAYEKHGYLELEVFENNIIGRRFYSKYGFKYLSKSIHEETGSIILKLKFTINERKQNNDKIDKKNKIYDRP
jgi:putative acetyltransferase